MSSAQKELQHGSSTPLTEEAQQEAQGSASPSKRLKSSSATNNTPLFLITNNNLSAQTPPQQTQQSFVSQTTITQAQILKATIPNSFTHRYIEEQSLKIVHEFSFQKKPIPQFQQSYESVLPSSFLSTSKNCDTSSSKIVMNIRDEFQNEKEYSKYMEQRFKRIFINVNNNISPASVQSSSNNYIEEEKSEYEGDLDKSFEGDDSKRRSSGGGVGGGGGVSQYQWNSEEKSLFIELLKKHGRDWATIAESLPKKTDKQCRNYFQNYKHKLNLIQYLPPNSHPQQSTPSRVVSNQGSSTYLNN